MDMNTKQFLLASQEGIPEQDTIWSICFKMHPELICRQFDHPSEHYPALTASNVANVSERSFLLYNHGLDDGDTRNSVVSRQQLGIWGSIQPLCLCFGQNQIHQYPIGIWLSKTLYL